MTPHRQLKLLIRITLLLCFAIVVFGAYVRLSASGLGCPDWPGCYGNVAPTGDTSNAKAWTEMIHRYAAGTLGLLIVVIAALAIQYRRQHLLPLPLALGLVALVVVQGIFGALTVTWQLKPLIVTGHLLFGLATLSMLWWTVLKFPRTAEQITFADTKVAGSVAPAWSLAALLALIVQISLGGWTSSNYAATACPDLPTCQGQWVPDADYHEGFVLWRGLGVNYEGGVLDQAARVAIHFMHRLGAIAATLLLVYVGHLGLRAARNSATRRVSVFVLAALGLQLLIGVSFVLRGFPLWLATLHNAGAALLLLATIALVHATRAEAPRGR